MQGGRKGGFLFLVRFVRLGYLSKEKDRHDHNQRHHGNRKQRQLPVQAQQSRQVDHKEENDAPYADGLIGIESAQGIDVRGGALDQSTCLRLIVIGKRQTLEVIKQIIAQSQHDPFRRLGRQPAAEKGKRTLSQRQAHKAQRDQWQGARQLVLP